MAEVHGEQGQYAEAVPLYRRALAIAEKALGPDHPDVAQSLNNLAELYHDQANYAEAEPLHRRALAINSITPRSRGTTLPIKRIFLRDSRCKTGPAIY